MKLLLLKIVTFIALACAFQHAQASRYKVYFMIDVFSCNSCNQIAKDLKEYPRLLHEGAFLFSSKDITLEQASAYVEEMFGQGFNVTVNKNIHKSIMGDTRNFKIPKIAIYDSAESKLVRSFPISEIWHKRDIIDFYLEQGKPYTVKRIRNNRISRLSGYKTINKVGDKIFVTAQTNGSKIYIYDLKTKQLDSIVITDKMLIKLYEIGGIKNVDLPRVKAYHKNFDMPMPLVQFYSDPYSDDRYFNTYLNTFYYDPDYTGDTIMPKGTSFFVNYDVQKKNLSLQEFEYYQSTPITDPFSYNEPSKYVQDWGYKKFVNDSTWIVSGDKLPDEGKEFSKTKVLLKYIRNNDTPYAKWVFSGHYDSLYVDSMYSYSHQSMNEQHSYYTYGYKPPYLYYCQSPIIKDFETDRTINMLNYANDIDWTFDIEFSNNLLYVYVQRNREGIFKYTFNRSDYSLAAVQTIFVEKGSGMRSTFDVIVAGENLEDMDYQSNVFVDKGSLYMMHKSGDILIFEE